MKTLRSLTDQSAKAASRQKAEFHFLAGISHHGGTLLGVCRKGGASAPPKPRLPSFARPAPRAACGCKLRGARDSEIIVLGL